MKYCIIIFILIATTITSQGQDLINGIVADSASFTPLPYVNIAIKGEAKGTITDIQGAFKIVASPDDTLLISSVGYHTLEVPVADWQASVILLAENVTVLNTITIEDRRIKPYEGMFDEENAIWEENNRKLPFYYSQTKKQKIKVGRLEQENLRVKTYVDAVIKNDELKKSLMERHKLSEKDYYDLLAQFNGQNYTIMYYLTAGELIKIINDFYAQHANRK